MSNLLFGFGSGSTGASLGSGAADAAGSDSGTPAVGLSLLFFLCSPLCASSASPSLITSHLFDPIFLLHMEWFRGILRFAFCHDLSGLCPFVVLDCTATWASNRGSEIVNVWLGDSFPLDSCSLKMATEGVGRGPVELPLCPLSTPRLSFSKGTPITLMMVSVSHRLCGSNLLISRTLKTPSAFRMKHSALLFRIPSQIPYWYLGCILFIGSVVICFASTFSPNGTNFCVGFLPCNLLNGVFSSRPFWHLDRMHPACSTNHGRTGALNVTLDGSYDSTQQHHRVLDEPIRLLRLPSPRLQW